MNYKNITKNESVDTGVALVLLCLLIGNVFFHIQQFNYIAIMILVITMSVPLSLKPAAFLWFNFSHFLGTIMSTILLSIIFFLIVTPVGFIVRIVQKDPLGLNAFKKETTSVLKIRNHLFSKKDLMHPF
jgi:hypothetical protein